MFEMITHLLPTLQDAVLSQLDKTRTDENGLYSFGSLNFSLYHNWFINDLAYAVDVFESNYPEYDLENPEKYLQKAGIELAEEAIRKADVSEMDGITVMALLEGIYKLCGIISENNKKFLTDPNYELCLDDPLLDIFLDFSIERWLLRLKEIDDLSPSDEHANAGKLSPGSNDIRK